MNSTLRRDALCAGAHKGPFWRRGWHMQRLILKEFHMLREDRQKSGLNCFLSWLFSFP